MVAWPAFGMAQPGPTCVQSGIAAGGDHACAYTGTMGTAMCWGDNSFGQNGNGSFNTPTPVPTVVVPRVAPTEIAPGQPSQLVAGQRHTCAILLPGTTPVCWGDDTSGQLGDGRSGAGVYSPTEVPVVDPNNGQPLNTVFAVAAGDQHSCALICPNQPCNVRCWGDNTVGQLGIGSAGGTSATPSNPVTFPPTPFIPSNPPPVAITAGGLHTCAVMQDNTARCWGDNSFGQIGNCSTPRSTAPTPATVNYGVCPTTALLADVVQIFAGALEARASLAILALPFRQHRQEWLILRVHHLPG